MKKDHLNVMLEGLNIPIRTQTVGQIETEFYSVMSSVIKMRGINTYCALLHFLLLGGKSHDQDVFPPRGLLLLLLELFLRLLQPWNVIG